MGLDACLWRVFITPLKFRRRHRWSIPRKKIFLKFPPKINPHPIKKYRNINKCLSPKMDLAQRERVGTEGNLQFCQCNGALVSALISGKTVHSMLPFKIKQENWNHLKTQHATHFLKHNFHRPQNCRQENRPFAKKESSAKMRKFII